MARRVFGVIASLALAVQLVIPQGYMPAPVTAGSPIVPCVSVFPAAFLTPKTLGDMPGMHGPMAHHSGDSGTMYCPFGVLVGTAGLHPALAVVHLVHLLSGIDALAPDSTFYAAPVRSFLARAPPRRLLI